MNKKQSKVIKYNPNECKANSKLLKHVKPKKLLNHKTQVIYKPDDWKTHDQLVKRTYPKIKFTDEIIHGNKEHIRELGPYHLFLTFVFSVPVDDVLAMESISYLFNSVQRKLFTRTNVKNNKCFSGVSIAERHLISK